MIAWAGLEMFRAGWETDLNVHPIRKWSLDKNTTEEAQDEEEKTNDEKHGGVLGVDGWRQRKP
jgi:N6-L-threonylcarbamoyladenine synthase